MNDRFKDVTHKAKSFFDDYGKLLYALLLLSLCLYSVVSLTLMLQSAKLRVTFLNVGQGDAILITTPTGKQMLIDGGPTNRILEELSDHISYFDRTLDVIVATHPDSDHVTGLIPVLNKYEVAKIITSNVKGVTGIFNELTEKIDLETKNIHVAQKNDVIDFGDGVVAHVLYPGNVASRDTNNGSVSMVIKYGEHSFLLTGDLFIQYEQELLEAELPKNITVFKAGHHGSRTSSGDVLLSYTHPEYVVISAGKDNDYGHPHKEALDRFTKYSKEIISTIDKGAITFVSDGRLLKVESKK